MSKKKIYNSIGYGFECPKCGKEMERRERKEPPKNKKQRYYYQEWDYCRGCNHVQHYDQFKKRTDSYIQQLKTMRGY